MRGVVVGLLVATAFILSGCQYLLGRDDGRPDRPARRIVRSGRVRLVRSRRLRLVRPERPDCSRCRRRWRRTRRGRPPSRSTARRPRWTPSMGRRRSTRISAPRSAGPMAPACISASTVSPGRRTATGSCCSTGSPTASTGRPPIPWVARSRPRRRRRRSCPARPPATVSAGPMRSGRGRCSGPRRGEPAFDAEITFRRRSDRAGVGVEPEPDGRAGPAEGRSPPSPSHLAGRRQSRPDRRTPVPAADSPTPETSNRPIRQFRRQRVHPWHLSMQGPFCLPVSVPGADRHRYTGGR